jgi:iron complex transport system permease protein
MSPARWFGLAVLLALSALVAVGVGAIAVPPLEIWYALTGGPETMPVLVVRTLRLPRVVLAMLVGAGLGMSGAALQGTMRNPLAEPYLLGVSGGAAVGAVVATMFGLGAVAVPLAAFVGAIIAVVAAFFVAHTAGTRACCSWPASSSAHSRTRRSWSFSRTRSRTSCATRCGG